VILSGEDPPLADDPDEAQDLYARWEVSILGFSCRLQL